MEDQGIPDPCRVSWLPAVAGPGLEDRGGLSGIGLALGGGWTGAGGGGGGYGGPGGGVVKNPIGRNFSTLPDSTYEKDPRECTAEVA